MQGEQLATADVGERGIAGDRSWGLVDRATGLTLTARREPELLFAQGMLRDDGRATVRLPDGTETDDDEQLSRWLHREVALVAAGRDTAPTYEIALDDDGADGAGTEWVTWNGPAGSFHDSTRTQVSIVGDGSLGAWPVRRFRPNVVVSGDREDTLVGHRVRVPGGVVLDVVKQIDRCVMVTRPQPGGIERDLDVLRTVNRERATFLGVGALVRHPGTMVLGEALRPEEPQLEEGAA